MFSTAFDDNSECSKNIEETDWKLPLEMSKQETWNLSSLYHQMHFAFRVVVMQPRLLLWNCDEVFALEHEVEENYNFKWSRGCFKELRSTLSGLALVFSTSLNFSRNLISLNCLLLNVSHLIWFVSRSVLFWVEAFVNASRRWKCFARMSHSSIWLLSQARSFTKAATWWWKPYFVNGNERHLHPPNNKTSTWSLIW